MNEHELKDRVLRRLRSAGGYWEKRWGGAYARPGVADINGLAGKCCDTCGRGAFVAIELKSPALGSNAKQHVTPTQWNYLSQIKAHGGFTIVSNDADDVMDQLQDIKGYR